MPSAKRKPSPHGEKRNAEKQKIRNLINQRFPKPGASLAGVFANPDESLFEWYAHNAVNVNSRKHRDHIKREVRDMLFNNEPLPAAARAWLIYVLAHFDEMPLTREVNALLFNNEPLPAAARAWLFYGLGKLKDLPHECKGRPLADRSEFKNALLEFIKTGAPIPRGQVVRRLQAASEELKASYDREASYEKIRAIYYSKAFQSRLSTHSSNIWPVSDFLTWPD